jgi:hypothetical protein
VNWRAAFAGERVGGGDWRTELAGDEGVQSAKACGKFGGGQASLAVERAKKILGGAFPFLRIAFETARDEDGNDLLLSRTLVMQVLLMLRLGRVSFAPRY